MQRKQSYAHHVNTKIALMLALCKPFLLHKVEVFYMKLQRIRKIFCPKCKSKKLILYEMFIGHVSYKQSEIGVDWINHKPLKSHPCYVTAECEDCKYMWRLRGITQLTSLFEFEDDEVTSPSPSPANHQLPEP